MQKVKSCDFSSETIQKLNDLLLDFNFDKLNFEIDDFINITKAVNAFIIKENNFEENSSIQMLKSLVESMFLKFVKNADENIAKDLFLKVLGDSEMFFVPEVTTLVCKKFGNILGSLSEEEILNITNNGHEGLSFALSKLKSSSIKLFENVLLSKKLDVQDKIVFVQAVKGNISNLSDRMIKSNLFSSSLKPKMFRPLLASIYNFPNQEIEQFLLVATKSSQIALIANKNLSLEKRKTIISEVLSEKFFCTLRYEEMEVLISSILVYLSDESNMPIPKFVFKQVSGVAAWLEENVILESKTPSTEFCRCGSMKIHIERILKNDRVSGGFALFDAISHEFKHMMQSENALVRQNENTPEGKKVLSYHKTVLVSCNNIQFFLAINAPTLVEKYFKIASERKDPLFFYNPKFSVAKYFASDSAYNNFMTEIKYYLTKDNASEIFAQAVSFMCLIQNLSLEEKSKLLKIDTDIKAYANAPIEVDARNFGLDELKKIKEVTKNLCTQRELDKTIAYLTDYNNRLYLGKDVYDTILKVFESEPKALDLCAKGKNNKKELANERI
ncbi:MAG: hypothetical protein WCR30_04200 [Clostridia bacterium]